MSKFGTSFRREPAASKRVFVICVQTIFIRINGKLHYLWRAVDQDGEVLDILVQRRKNKSAAKKFLRKLLKGRHYAPGVIITDQLQNYSAAKAPDRAKCLGTASTKGRMTVLRIRTRGSTINRTETYAKPQELNHVGFAHDPQTANSR